MTHNSFDGSRFRPWTRASIALLAVVGAVAALGSVGRTWSASIPLRTLADFHATGRTVARDGAPLWNGRVGIGEPLLAQPEAGAVAPSRLFLAVADPATAARLAAHAVPVVAGLGMFALLAAIGCSLAGALIGAVAMALAAPLVGDRHDAAAIVASGVPWVLWATERLARRPGSRRVALLAGIMGISALGGHLPAVVVVAGIAIAWAVCRPGGIALRAVLGTLVATALGAAIAAPWLLPALAEWNAGTTALSPTHAGRATAALGLALPATIHAGSAAGGVAFALALVGVPFGLIAGTAPRGVTSRFVFLGAIAAVGAIFIDDRLALLVAIATAGGAAIGFEALVRGRGEGGPPPLTIAVLLCGALILGSGVIGAVFHVVTRDPAVTFEGIFRHAELLRILPSLAVRAAAVMGATIVVALFLRGPFTRPVTAALVLLATFVEGIGGQRWSEAVAPDAAADGVLTAAALPDATRRTAVGQAPRFGDVRFVDRRTPPAYAAVIQRLPTATASIVQPALARFDVERIVSPVRLGVPLAPRWVGPGEHAIDRISLVDAWGGGTGLLWTRVEATPPFPADAVIARVTVRSIDERVVTISVRAGRDPTELPLQTISGTLATLEVAYLASRGRLWLDRISPGRELPTTAWGRRGPHPLLSIEPAHAKTDQAIFVYGWPDRPGRAWFARQSQVVSDPIRRAAIVAERPVRETVTARRLEDLLIADLFHGGNPGSNRRLADRAQEGNPGTAGGSNPGMTRAADGVSIRDSRDGYLTLGVGQGAGWVVVSECYSPGWTASIGDTTLETTAVDHTLIGVRVPAGPAGRRITLRYAPPGLTAGLAAAAAAVIALLFLVLRSEDDRHA